MLQLFSSCCCPNCQCPVCLCDLLSSIDGWSFCYGSITGAVVMLAVIVVSTVVANWLDS